MAVDHQCGYCGALQFHGESINCCHNGKVSIPPLQAVATTTHTLLCADTEEGCHFHEHIFLYNSFSCICIYGGKYKHFTWLWPILLLHPRTDLHTYISYKQVHFTYMKTYQVFLSIANSIGIVNTYSSIGRVQNHLISKMQKLSFSFFLHKSFIMQ